MDKKDFKKYIRDFVKLRLRSPADLRQAKRILAKKYGSTILSNALILGEYRRFYKGKTSQALVRLLRKREIRTLSGIAPVTVLTKPYPCPGRCIYCPAPLGMPKSYIASEPAAQRAFSLKFDPYQQVKTRIQVLEANGHDVEKIELIVLGGTWSFYPQTYREWFIKRCFEAANGKKSVSLLSAQKINETAKHRIIGLSLETRPDFIMPEELQNMRKLGCTHVQIGIQSVHQEVLDFVRRNDTLENMARATALLRDYGFKITYHLMPGLPGSTPAKDLAVFREVFSDPRWQPDMLKIYPCVVVKNSVLYRWYKKGKYHPYSDKTLIKLITRIKSVVPPYVRINRLVRDIPGPDIVAGNLKTNLRQLLQNQGVKCRCIRCREVRQEINSYERMYLINRQYRAGQGREYFLSFENENKKKLYAFLRLRLPDKKRVLNEETPFDSMTAVIRELHTYGELVPVGEKGKAVQHLGLGKRLMIEAEKLAQSKGYKKMAVISGVGVRGYYRKIGYKLRETYMIKDL
ncbi:MAG: tRNA uridine(34) 5-carboxymethylaminomethyl modification radical SAM/GNAT enzyme Elp3 [Patescibacteria group bacterium]|jgi:elongator complex protein 3